MTNVLPIEAAGAITPDTARTAGLGSAAKTARVGSFPDMLLSGINKVNQQLISADTLATNFALDDSIPVHRVTYALEQARMSVEMMLQVRAQLMDGYQEILKMQL